MPCVSQLCLHQPLPGSRVRDGTRYSEFFAQPSSVVPVSFVLDEESSNNSFTGINFHCESLTFSFPSICQPIVSIVISVTQDKNFVSCIRITSKEGAGNHLRIQRPSTICAKCIIKLPLPLLQDTLYLLIECVFCKILSSITCLLVWWRLDQYKEKDPNKEGYFCLHPSLSKWTMSNPPYLVCPIECHAFTC